MNLIQIWNCASRRGSQGGRQI